VGKWLDAECDGFAGMQVTRSQAWGDIQAAVDGLYRTGAFGMDSTLREDVPSGTGQQGGEPIGDALRSSAARLLEPCAGISLPSDLVAQVQADAENIGAAVAALIPAARTLSLKLELVGENSCKRWHQDHYVARVIVSYNCQGTEFVHDDHVDHWQLRNGGKNHHIVRDSAAVCRAGVGDILLMKGTLFPGSVNGLLHRSPDPLYHSNGAVKARLILKVDVDTL
jgi:hypothetical protein